MTVDQTERMRSLFTEAQEHPPDQREAFLQRTCPDDEALRREVAALLRCEEEADGFLEESAFGRGLDLIQRTEAGKLKPGDTVGDCQVVSLLGVGGMGEVYLAHDAVHDRQVALKLIGQGRAEEVRGRHFRHERKVLAALNHPHIARLYGSGTTAGGQAYLVMEYVEGEQLDDFCQANGLSVDERLALFRKICAAVAYAHQNLVVHRDLKPANIRVTPEGEPKLLDFGIAKLLEPESDTNPTADPTVTLHGAMTPEYASPEQLKGERITTATDVYSLGVILYELLSGQRPFAYLKGRRVDELARAVCEEEPPRPSKVLARTNSVSTTRPRRPERTPATHRPWPVKSRHRVDGDLDNIVARAMQKDPARRYASVPAFSEDLSRYGEGLPVSARRDTLGYRAGKFVRRHKVSVAAAALVVVALLVGLAATVWQARAARRERDLAHLAQQRAERLNAFLETLLASADDSHAGKDEKVSVVLGAASRNLDRELAGEPELLARAHQTLSRSYRQLGLLAPAEEHARAALVLVYRLHKADEPATAKAEVILGDILTGRHQWDEAVPLLRHALEVLRRQSVPDESTLAVALTSLGFCLCRQDRPDQAEPLMMDALAHARIAWGEQSPSYARFLIGLGNVKESERDYAAAEQIYRRVLALEDQLAPGGEHSTILLMNLTLTLLKQDKWTEARHTLGRLDDNARHLFGEKSVYTTFATYGYGVLDAIDGNYPAAIARFREALPVLIENYAPNHATLVQCRAWLGLCLTRTGHAAEGEPFLRAALADGARINPNEFNSTVGSLEGALGECLLMQKRYPEAEPLLLAGHAGLEKRLGSQNRLTLQIRQCLHDLYLDWNKPAEARRFEAQMTVQSAAAR